MSKFKINFRNFPVFDIMFSQGGIEMDWCFAMINNKLAEVYFEKKGDKVKFLAHCFVKRSEFKTKAEKSWIEADTRKVRLSYEKRHYNWVVNDKRLPGLIL